MIFKKDKSFKFEWEGLEGWALSSKEDFEDASAAYFEVTGSHGQVRSKSSNRVYYILEGEGTFDINGKTETVKTSDVVIVPKNTPYDYKATSPVMKLFLVHAPAYAEADEVRLD